MKIFEGKAVLVTGAGSGIGKATALLFAKEGAKVLVADVTEAHNREVVGLIQKGGGEAVGFVGDVSNPKDCEAMVKKALDSFGRLDAAVNNAGIAGDLGPTADYSLEGWQKVISVNLSGVFYCMKYEIPALLKAGKGAIVNVSSILGQVAFAGAPAYTAAKHGVVGLTRVAAVEYAAKGVRVNVVGPAFIETPMIAPVTSEKAAKDMIVSMHPIGRLGRPEEVAELLVWLCSDKASFVTGSYYAVDGGYLAR
jgi:NAD(P)-dependent dehydrogenase (short-subunit alcohol dehydrogenase family)